MHGNATAPGPIFLPSGGEMGALMGAHDWSTSPLGPPETWPQSLHSVVGLLLGSKFPMFVAWGPELGLLYNDAYAEILGAKHPHALGRRFQDIWAEIWPDIQPMVDAALAGEASYHEDLPLVVRRRGFDEPAWFTFSYSPVLDERGAVAGMYCVVAETTGKVLTDRRLRESEARTRGVLDGMAEGFVLLDRDFRVVEINDEGMRLEERPRDEIVGRTHWEAWPSTEVSELGRLYQRAMIERVPVSLQHRYVWPDGREAWLDVRVYPTADGGLALFYRDVTERVRTETAVRESEARLSFLDRLGAETAPLADANAVLTTTTRLLGEHLNLSVCAYADMDEDEDGFTIRGNWAAPGSRSIVGRYRLAAFGKLAVKNLAAGLPLVVNDNLRELAPQEAASFQGIGIAATICMPLVKEGRLTALMAIHDRVPRV